MVTNFFQIVAKISGISARQFVVTYQPTSIPRHISRYNLKSAHEIPIYGSGSGKVARGACIFAFNEPYVILIIM